MLIPYNKKREEDFELMLRSHQFSNYLGLTHNFKGFEVPNLSKTAKVEFLKKLNISSVDNLPAFEDFWKWVLNNHGVELSYQMATFLYPEGGQFKECEELEDSLNNERKTIHKAMLKDSCHPLWMHIRARMYKKWSSIMTEAQCSYALLAGIESNNLNWKLFSSPLIDVLGVDMVIVTEKEAIPIQVKKDSTSMFSSHKDNRCANFHRYSLNPVVKEEINRVFKEENMIKHIAQGMILKYDVKKNNTQTYKYLKKWDNGFVYFDGHLLVKELKEYLKNYVNIPKKY